MKYSKFSAHVLGFNANGQCLLVKRRDIPVWVIPGGQSEPKETPKETALREFWEETGIRLKEKNLTLAAYYLPHNNQIAKYTFICRLKPACKPIKTSESSAFGFFSLDNLPHPITFYEKQRVYEASGKHFGDIIIRSNAVNIIKELINLLSHPLLLLCLLFRYFYFKKIKPNKSK